MTGTTISTDTGNSTTATAATAVTTTDTATSTGTTSTSATSTTASSSTTMSTATMTSTTISTDTGSSTTVTAAAAVTTTDTATSTGTTSTSATSTTMSSTTPAPVLPTPAPSTPAPPATPAPCADDDAQMIEVVESITGHTIGGCADMQSYCEHAAYGSTVQAICPATCRMCAASCTDDDTRIIELASGAGLTISGCADVQSFCHNAAYGSTVQATCPATCGSCTAPVRRMTERKDPIADEFDWIDELTFPQ